MWPGAGGQWAVASGQWSEISGQVRGRGLARVQTPALLGGGATSTSEGRCLKQHENQLQCKVGAATEVLARDRMEVILVHEETFGAPYGHSTEPANSPLRRRLSWPMTCPPPAGYRASSAPPGRVLAAPGFLPRGGWPRGAVRRFADSAVAAYRVHKLPTG